MVWCRQYCALMRKNRIIKFRLWGSTLAEILLPVFVMLIMVGIREAITKEDLDANLHLDKGLPLSQFNATALSVHLATATSRRNEGTGGVNQFAFVPGNDPLVQEMSQAFRTRFPALDDAGLVTDDFHSEAEMEKYVRSPSYSTAGNPGIFAAVVLKQTGTKEAPHWTYSIRQNSSGIASSASTIYPEEPTVDRLKNQFDSDWYSVLAYKGHWMLQNFVESFIVEKQYYLTNDETSSINVADGRDVLFQPFPTPPYIKDSFGDVVAGSLGLFFTLIYIWPVTRLVKGIVEEKQLRIKEGMKMMGLKDSAHFCSWFTTYFLIFFLTSVLVAAVTMINVFSNSNPVYVFFFFFLFAMSVFSFCWLMSVFFSRSQVATTFSALIFLFSYFPAFAVEGPGSSSGQKTAACIASPICFGLGSVVMAKLDSAGNGINPDTAGIEVDNFTYNAAIGMLIFDFFFYLLLGLYFQQVVPSEWGTQRKWYFLCQPSFWRPKAVQVPNKERAAMGAAEGGEAEMANLPPHQPLQESPEPALASPSVDLEPSPAPAGAKDRSYYFEAVSRAVRENLGVSIRALRKVFKREGEPEFVAVQGLNLDLYQNQIVALLGHNGAGKTTTINMLTGMIAPSSGDALVYGTSIIDNMSGVRKILGVCPQHDILYDLLTVREHLELFAALKDVPKEEVDKQIDDMIAQVGLTEKVNDKSAALSGGMKRKLSVGIALLGDSKIVFLDEPTSGMDPYSRRSTWDLLKKKKEGRVIILTTHFMDEADQLGDRIAIMAKGDVKCCGSSLFLKGRYGVGYTLTLTKADNFDEEAVKELIHDNIPGSTQLSHIAAEISFRLPFQASAHFADVFDKFDAEKQHLGIVAYGISVTTLEEVFLRVGHEEDAAPEALIQRRHEREESQRRLSISANESPQPPQDVYDMPSEPPEIMIDGSKRRHGSASSVVEDEEERKSSAPRPSSTSNKLASAITNAAAASSGSGEKGGINTISVKPSPRGTPDADAPSSQKQKRLASRQSSSRFNRLTIPPASTSMYRRHFKALLVKRWLNAKRDKKVWTWTLLYPFLILLIGIGLLTQLGNSDSRETLSVSVANLKQDQPLNVVPYFNAVPPTNLFDTSAIPQVQFEAVPAGVVSPADNITAYSQWLLDQIHPTPMQSYSRYTALHTSFHEDPTTPGTYLDQFVVYFNTTCQWCSALGLNQYSSQLLSHVINDPTAKIELQIQPLPFTLNQQTLVNSIAAVVVAIGFAFMPANFVSYAVKEDSDKIKHQQLISGVSAASYWTANFVWDFCNYMVMALLCMAIFAIWDLESLIGSNTGGVFIALLLYGLSVIPFTYLTSFLFQEHTSAQNSMLLFYIFTGALLLIASMVLSILDSTKDIMFHLKFVCRLIPSYSFGEAIMNIITRESVTAFGTPQGIFTMDILGFPAIFMVCEFIVYFALVLLYEKILATPSLSAMLFGNPTMDAPNVPDEDADVIAERARLQAGGSGENDTIQIKALRKVYKGRLGGGNKIAVQDLWLGIPQGQCFGYLGINGAGKTTTLKMLTGDIIPTSGTATLSGLDILKQQNDVRRLLGYCPQFDSLLPLLTAREHLTLFARIKGVPEDIIPDYCEHLIMRLGLQEGIADKPCQGYSGGNKRKLCVGIALIGNPPIVFLDEPSTGMDPGSRRFMWDLIASTMKNRSVILTTHSMEECEALCHRIGIMVGGRLRCLGSTTRLKDVYGDGYQLDVNVSEEKQSAFKTELESAWPSVKIIEQHGDALKFRLPRQVSSLSGAVQLTTIGSVFRFMEELKKQYGISDYSVSETTLEQIFLNFAKQQEEEKGPVAGLA